MANNLEVFFHSSRVSYSDTGLLLYVTGQTSNFNGRNYSYQQFAFIDSSYNILTEFQW